MKRSTAVHRLTEIASELERAKAWPGPTIVAGYAFGELIDATVDVERIHMALVVDQQAEDVPWMSHPARLEALASMLRLDRLPVSWWWRPDSWPVWNHAIRRAACVWSASTGSHEDALDALATARTDHIEFVEPSGDDQLVAQVRVERDLGRRHLEATAASYHNREWRRHHKGDGIYPEDHLWWAATGYLDLDNALHEAEV